MYDCGTAEEDDPATWETLFSPRAVRRGPPLRLLRTAWSWMPEQSGQNKHPHRGKHTKGRPEVAILLGSLADGEQGVGWPNTSRDGGEREGTRTQRSKGGQC